MDYVAKHATEIEVANMSLGWVGNSTAARTAVQSAVSKGVVFAVAAGNDGQDIWGADGILGTGDDAEPASFPEVATISALVDTDGASGGLGPTTGNGPDDTLATFSNFSGHVPPNNPVNSPGGGIDLAAPGVDIFSTYLGNSYATGSGTSMATPHATGAFALYIAANGRANNAAGVAAIRQALINGAQSQNNWGPADTHDRENFKEGLAYVGTGSGPPVDPPPVVTINSPANGANPGSGSSILFSGTATDGGVNLTSSMSWTSSRDGAIGSGGSFTRTLSNGLHTIIASATDSDGKTGSSSVTITVGCAPTSVSVASITYTLTNRKRDLNSIVKLRDNCGNLVVGATVSVMIINTTRLGIWTGTGTTGSNGSETFLLKSAPAGRYETQVTEVTASGLTWDGTYPPNSFKK
jgi:subtilisin family serine protease